MRRWRNIKRDINAINTLIKLNINLNREGGMVVGHTIQEKINTSYCNKLWKIDTGMSIAFGRKKKMNDRIQVLEIIDDGREINIINS